MDRQEHKVERRLVAIFAANMAGYSRLMAQDEDATLQSLTTCRGIMGLITESGGRIANTAGNSVLAEFPSAVMPSDAPLKSRSSSPKQTRIHLRSAASSSGSECMLAT